MANRLTMAKISAIQSLHQSGYSNRRIAELLDVDRETVAKYVARLQNPPDHPSGGAPPPGSEDRPDHLADDVCPEAVDQQSSEAFIGALENAFRHFGGVPKTLVIDNLKAAVKRGDWYDPEIHPKLQSFSQHYGTVFLPTKPYTPQHKGKVESGVKYVKHNALKSRTFSSLSEQNEFLRHWEQHVADTRIHGTTKRQIQTQFAHGAYRLRTIRELIKRQTPAQQQFDFLDEHPVIRPLSDYSLASLLQFRKERSS